MKSFIPASTELIHRVYALSGGQYALSVGLIHRFALHPDGQKQFKENASGIWPIAKKALGDKAILDEGIPKQQGEFLAYGSAFSSKQNQDQPVLAKIVVGSSSKRLAVYGDRTINTANWISRPREFKEMPITPENAFGGKEYKLNPFGKGFQKIGDSSKLESQWPMPNIENPERLMALQTDTPLPAGFWAFPSDFLQRTELLGNFDESWLKKRWPHPPLDTNPSYNQTAPVDQRIPSYFQGNESVEIFNMHSEHEYIKSSLPNVRARLFVERELENSDHEFVELISNLETVWLFPNHLCGLILFRAKVEASNFDADNIVNVYAALESILEAPKEIGFHYQNYLIEIGKGSGPIAAAEEIAQDPPPPHSEEESQVEAVKLPQIDVESPPSIPKPETIESILKNDPQIQEIRKQFNISDNEIKKRMEQMVNPSSLSPQEAMQELQKAIKQLTQLLEGSETSNDELIKLLSSRSEGAQAAAMLSSTPGGLLGLVKTLEQDLSKEPLKMPEVPEEKPETPEDKPTPPSLIDRQWVVSHHQQGLSFADLELNGLDLSNLDLTKADFSKSQLIGVNFQKSILVDTVFNEALLTEADFTSANLSNSSMKKISAGKSKFVSAKLTAAILSESDFTESDFSNANLTEANLKKANFNQSNLTTVNATSSNAESAAFDNCSMEGSIFNKAHLKMTSFAKAKLSNSQFEQAACSRTEFSGANVSNSNFTKAILFDSEAHKEASFESCNFTQAKMNGINWNKANLKNVVLTQAELNQADFTGSNLEGAIIIQSIAKNSVFDKTNLERANLSNSNFFEGSFRGAQIINCHMELSNFYGVDFLDTKIQNSTFEGANIDRTILAVRSE